MLLKNVAVLIVEYVAENENRNHLYKEWYTEGVDIGINFNSYLNIDNNERIRLMKKYGFNHTFIVVSQKDVDEQFELCEANGIVVDSCHGPYKGINNIWLDSDEGDDVYFDFADAVNMCAEHHVPYLVLHLSSGVNPPHISDIGYERFSKLAQLAKEKNVTLAFENQRKIANLAFALEEFKDAVLCWDCGHEGCFAKGKQFMPMFGERMKIVHLHDNHKEFNQDLHMIPYDASIDFDHVCAMLKQYGFNETVMLEIHETNYDGIDPEEFYRRAAEAANRIRDNLLK